MTRALEVEPTLTDRYRTAVPETVRHASGLNKRDKIHHEIRPSGEVVLTRAEASEDDPLIGQLLGFLAKDSAGHPENLQAIDASLVSRIHALVGNIDVDLEAALAAEDE